MADEISLIGKIGPWLASLVFGAGAGIGGAKVVIAGHEKRISALEKWTHDEGLTKEFHCVKCAKAQAEAALATERVVNAAMDRMFTEMHEMRDKILARIDSYHDHSRKE